MLHWCILLLVKNLSMNSELINVKNTKYLTWYKTRNSVVVHGNDFKVVVDSETEIHHVISTGWSGYLLYHPERYKVKINSSIARQLTRHLKFIREESSYDVSKIKYWV